MHCRVLNRLDGYSTVRGFAFPFTVGNYTVSLWLTVRIECATTISTILSHIFRFFNSRQISPSQKLLCLKTKVTLEMLF